MKAVLRLFLALICAASTYFFTYWMGAALIYSMNGPLSLAMPIAAVLAVLVGWFVWRRSAALEPSLATSILLGAVVTGGVAFACGFFGPLIFAPESNQGPLLGLFFTGPLGFLLGAIGGAVYWKGWGQKRL